MCVYTDEVLKWDKKFQKNQQSLTVSSRVNFGCVDLFS